MSSTSKKSAIEYSDDLFSDLGFDRSESVSLKLKADLYAQILRIIRENNYKQHDISKILDIPQPRVSELLRGKIDRLRLEKLIQYTEALYPNMRIEVRYG